MNKIAKFQSYSIRNKEVIKDLAMPNKNAIFCVNHVTQKVLTSAPGGHIDLKFLPEGLQVNFVYTVQISWKDFKSFLRY